MSTTSRDRANWTAVKTKLEPLSPPALITLVHDLYRASPENRRFLHARLLGPHLELAKYRQLVSDAVFPDPFSSRSVRVGEAQRLIRHYRQATGDVPGTVELLLTFVEAGTEQAADLGYEDERYFAALERALDTAVALAPDLPSDRRRELLRRVRRLAERASAVGWGYGDYVGEVAADLGPSA
jgi:hypothetical protein